MTYEQTVHDTNEALAPTRLPTWLSVFGGGLVVGVVLGLTLAPARGRDTRRAIARAARDGRERAAKLMRRGPEAAAGQHARVERLVRTAGEYVRNASESIGEQTQAVKSAFGRTREGAEGR